MTHADLVQSLAGKGAEVVGRSGRLIRARLPADLRRLASIASLDTVDGIAATPAEVKLAGFEDSPRGRTPVFVTLMPDDPDGRWRRAMERLGAVVGAYDSEIRVYNAVADAMVVNALVATDFVLAVEPIGVVEATHDTAVPAMGADALRAAGGASAFYAGTGGASVPVAVMDTGLNINHLDIASGRDSVCGANFVVKTAEGGSNLPLEEEDLWLDAHGHGTHVTGTIAGLGVVQPRFAGMAPGVRHIRFAKVLNRKGFGTMNDIAAGMDFLAKVTGCSEGGRMSGRVKPQIVNMSLGGARLDFDGRGFSARKLDATVWNHRQLYVVANSNAGRFGFSNYGASKNALAVGATMDSGELAGFSSHGPTADGRLAPNVVATGVRVHSAAGNGGRGAYVAYNGTSMASPAVAGVAALLLDAVNEHRGQPALTRARLMASAIRPEAWLAEGAGFASDNNAGPGPLQALYGLGKVSARTAVLQRDQPDGWRSGSATAELSNGEYAYHDIDVAAGASRLDVVLTWDEPPADAVASTVLNDLDLWLDRDGDCEPEPCGEHASRSRLDNVEWIIVRNPEPGTYRIKVIANRVYTAAPRAAVAWTVIRGTSTPTLAVTPDKERLAPGGRHDLKLVLTADGYLAAGTRLHIDCRSASTSCEDAVAIESVAMSRADGVRVGLVDEARVLMPNGVFRPAAESGGFGAPIPVGEIAVGDERTVHLVVALGAEADGARLHFTASAWNGHAGQASVGIGSAVDAVPVRPINDAFSAATTIEGEEGTRQLDLLRATPEPGEPNFDITGRPVGSLWYVWTAPTDGPFRFGVLREQGSLLRNDRVEVFQGDGIAALREVASGPWGVSFFAEQGEAYRIRVGSGARGTAFDLRWSPDVRPANDDFANATLLAGESGSFEGSSAGATLEPGESFGVSIAATTWFRWEAPEDGLWRFGTEDGRRLFVFEGDEISALRLVGPRPLQSATFSARAGREYRIAVAEVAQEITFGADSWGGDYKLDWARSIQELHGNDWFVNAESVGGDGTLGAHVEIDINSTVEPGEPPESGVRTEWWAWEPPADGLYTWRLADREWWAVYPLMRVSMFQGTAFNELELVGETGPGAPFDFLVDAFEGEQYSIAVGFATGDVSAFEQMLASATLNWGTTPHNDDLSGGTGLTGSSGSITGSNAFATTGRGDLRDMLGRSTLWWTYRPQTSGWVRFSVEGDGGPWVLTVHRISTDELGREVIASSRWQRSDGNAVEVLVELEAHEEYALTLGTGAAGQGGPFTLHWQDAEAPAWLRYVRRLADGGRDSRDEPVLIRGPGHLALNGSGDSLYLGSQLGLQVFERDPESGRLHQTQMLETDQGLADALLIWDPARGRLVANDCGTWRVFEPDDGSGALLEDELPVLDDPGTCAESLLMDEAGSNVYRVGTLNLETFSVAPEGGLQFVESHALLGGGIVSSAISNDGLHLYVATGSELRVFGRDTQTGTLNREAFAYDLGPSYAARGTNPLAISDDDAHLFAFRGGDNVVHVFSLENPTSPVHLDDLPKFWDAHWDWERCSFADARSDSAAVDVLCPGLAITARWDPEAGELVGTDFLTPQADRFNGVPLPEFAGPASVVATGDDVHIYVSTPGHGILTFARVD